jgi:hypothetical protein
MFMRLHPFRSLLLSCGLIVTGLFAMALSTPAFASAATAKPASMLLTISQMPVGWSVDNSAGGSGSVGCLNLSKRFDAFPHAVVSFDASGGLPELAESVYMPPSARTLMNQVIKVIAACPRFTGNLSGKRVTGSVGAMSFPRIGDDSVAYSVTLTVEGVTFYDDFVLARRGNVLMQLQLLDMDPNVNLLVQYGKIGVRKLV